MLPEVLAHGDEQEILKLAYDIGLALKKAHKKNVLHRDVKLENVFYSEKKKQYKLGDFGIAKKTEDGFAGTIAFTKGYAAPEVGYKKEHKNSSLVVGSITLALGIVAWKLTMASNMIISFSLWEYIFLAGCLGKGILKAFKKDITFLSAGVLGIGIYLMVRL